MPRKRRQAPIVVLDATDAVVASTDLDRARLELGKLYRCDRDAFVKLAAAIGHIVAIHERPTEQKLDDVWIAMQNGTINLKRGRN